jgi:hypothetical protein
MPWLLARTAALQERKVAGFLSEHFAESVTTYIPMRRVTVRSRHVRRPRVAEYPAFATYLFVHAHYLMHGVRALHHSIIPAWPVRFGDELATIADGAITDLQRMEASGALSTEGVLLRPGDRVELTTPAFMHQVGMVTRVLVPGVRYKVALSNCWVSCGLDELRIII